MKANKKINLEFLLVMYDCLLRGMGLSALAATLEVPQDSLVRWRKTREDVMTVHRLAAERKKTLDDVGEYMLGKLSKPARKIWKQVEFYLESNDNKVPSVVRQELATHVRQELFLHAMMLSNWNMSKSCRLAGVTREQALKWNEEIGFKKALKELQEAKKDFFEDALMGLVRDGYPGAIVFANRTQNADRGYTEKVEVKHSGMIHHSALNLDELELSFETRREILNAVRKKRELRENPKELGNGSEVEKAAENTENTIDAEVVPE